MKKYLLFIFFILFGYSSYGQILSNCTNHAALIGNAYAKDINYLAVQRLYDIQSPDTTLIAVPQIYSDSILKAMLGVYNLGTQLEADSVFSKHCIHEFRANDDHVYIEIDTAVAWTAAWQNQQTITTNPQVNSLLIPHGFSFVAIHYFSNVTFVTLKTNNLINLKAFCDSLSQINGVLFARIDEIYAYGDQIKYNYSNNSYNLEFTIQYYPTIGPREYLTWNYFIDNNCQVTMNKTLNNPTYNPPLTNCNLWPNGLYEITRPEFSFYPNPSSEFINISVAESGTISLYDIKGTFVKSIKIKAGVNVLDISNQANGIYFLKFQTRDGIYFTKIVKE